MNVSEANPPLEQKHPAATVWVSLVEALTWIHYEHSVDLAALLSGALDQLRLSENELRIELECAWHELADGATTRPSAVRGKRDGEKHERALSVDDLRNCRFLVWNKLGQTARSGWLKETDDRMRTVVRVERHPDTREGAWDRLHASVGDDYYDLVVLREPLLALFPASKPSMRRFRTTIDRREAAKRYLADFCDAHSPKTIPKRQLLAELRAEFDLPARRAEAIWNSVTETRSAWRAPGRPRKTPSQKSPSK